MKRINILIAISLLGTAVIGSPLDTDKVASDAKWLAHIDVDALKESTVGNFFIDLARQEAKKSQESSVTINFDEVLGEIHSVTAYGSSYEDKPADNSVLFLSTGPRAQSIAEGYIAHQQLTSEDDSAIKAVEDKDYPTYLIGDQVFLSFPRERLIVVSKSFDQIERALFVMDGARPNVATSPSELNVDAADGFFFLAAASGFDGFKDMPPQARILQKATGGQLGFGESDSLLRTNFRLNTSSSTVASQLARIIQGMLALASFAEVDNASLKTLTDRAIVSEANDHVSLTLEYPADDALNLIKASMKEDEKKGDHPGKVNEQAESSPLAADAIGGERLRVGNVDAKSDNGNLPRNATDSDPLTYWGAQGRSQWIRFELQDKAQLQEIQIAWRRGDERRTVFAVEVSENGVDWDTLLELRSSGHTTGLESYNVPDTSTRWIRLLCRGNSDNEMNVISDVRFFGSSAGSKQ